MELKTLDLVVRDPHASTVALATLVESACGCGGRSRGMALLGRLVGHGDVDILLTVPLPKVLDQAAVIQKKIREDLYEYTPASGGAWSITLLKVNVPGGRGATFVGTYRDHATGRVLEVTAADEPLTLGTILVIAGIVLLACVILKGIDYYLSGCGNVAAVRAACPTPPCSVTVRVTADTSWDIFGPCDMDVSCEASCTCPPSETAAKPTSTVTTTTVVAPDGTTTTTTTTKTGGALPTGSGGQGPFGTGAVSEGGALGSTDCGGPPFEVTGAMRSGPTKDLAEQRARSAAHHEANDVCPSNCPAEELSWKIIESREDPNDLPEGRWKARAKGTYACRKRG